MEFNMPDGADGPRDEALDRGHAGAGAGDGASGPEGVRSPGGSQEVVAVPIALLQAGFRVRALGCSEDHVDRLAGVDDELPPILVDRRTMRVIDGAHRVEVAVRKGKRVIAARLFDGPSEEAFLRAVEANVAHGLPLSLADRRAAAEEIVSTHPQLSDRAIARITGLGARSVVAIRQRLTDVATQLNARVGRDGRVRPLDAAEGRRRAAAVIAQQPEASLREVAKLAGISPATVSDVRKRLEAGLGPVPPARPLAQGARRPSALPPAAHRGAGASEEADRQVDVGTLVDKLLRDPALRHKESGRQLLRLLRQNAIHSQEWSDLISAVPPHCRRLVVDLARQYSETWSNFAELLDTSPGAMRARAGSASGPVRGAG